MPQTPAYGYTVRPGDTLSGIASRHGTTVRKIVRLNPRKIHHRDLIFPGQKLKVRGKARKHHPHRKVGGPIPAAGSWHRHSGYSWAIGAWDINIEGSGDCGNPVRSTRAGVVVFVAHWSFSYGTHVIIRGSRGNLRYYAHLSRERVHIGERVRRGQFIGRVGSTGNATGCHLHYEIRAGFGNASHVQTSTATGVTPVADVGDAAFLGPPRTKPPWSVWWRKVARCESSLRWHINTGNGYFGGLQFFLPTWLAHGGARFAFWPHHATPREQKTVAERVLRTQGIGAWPVCGPPALK